VVPSGSSGFFAALRMTATTCNAMQQQKQRQAAWFSLPSPEGRVSLCVLDCKPGGLMLLRRTVFRLFVLGLFSFGYAAVPQSPQPPQNPQARPAPGGGRPQPSRPNPGGPQIQPVRPGPGGGNNRPQPGRPNPGVRPPPRPTPRPPVRPGRPPQWGRPPASRPSYGWRPDDRAWLHRYYARNLAYINIARRPRFAIGGFFPVAFIPYISPVPAPVYSYLPPPPPGYEMGYYDGYVVVYDPVTYFIANVIDLMQQ
jgi:hypothetical protein